MRKIKSIIKNQLGDKAKIDDVLDHVFDNRLVTGSSATAYQVKHEYKKRKRANPEKSMRSILMDISADFNISYVSAYRYLNL